MSKKWARNSPQNHCFSESGICQRVRKRGIESLFLHPWIERLAMAQGNTNKSSWLREELDAAIKDVNGWDRGLRREKAPADESPQSARLGANHRLRTLHSEPTDQK
jgi:hypothetical protein